jgi:hypothetical protein
MPCVTFMSCPHWRDDLVKCFTAGPIRDSIEYACVSLCVAERKSCQDIA